MVWLCLGWPPTWKTCKCQRIWKGSWKSPGNYFLRVMCYCKLCNRFKINVTGDLRKVENVPDWLSKYLEKSGIIWCRLEYGHPVCFPVIFPWMLDNSMLWCGYYKPLSFTGVTWVEDRRVSKLQNPYGFLLKHPVRHGVTPEKRSL